MERIGSAVLGTAIIFVGALMIVAPQFVDILRGVGAYLLWNGIFLMALGVIKLVNGIEGFPRITSQTVSAKVSDNIRRVRYHFVPKRDLLQEAANEAKVVRSAEIKPYETELSGRWVAEDGGVRGDAVCDRIKWLVEHRLRKIAISPESGAWETLFQDPNDDRYWERTYPLGERHGGGPPTLKCLSRDEAKVKYGDAMCR